MNERSVFIAALQMGDADERSDYLARACGDDPALRQRVEGLLAAYVEAGSFIAVPAVACDLLATVDRPVAEQPGMTIGPYKLLEQIGEGGFGIVFMAEQTQPVRRKVALKVLKPGMDTRQVIARFEAERQALALMDHPHIAHVFDGGATSAGRPYFVMELVRGVPITEFCDQRRLTIPERLRLFVDVCQPVQHAHQKGVIHRDIKPSNVMVTLYDGQPTVKVIDFGIAKALGQQLTEKTLFTNFAQMIGTPLYMPPEQVSLSGQDVDTRGDIYSLGVLLYELLTGTTPFEKERLSKVGYDELRRIIREEEPPKPSDRMSTVGKAAANTACEQRQSDPRKLSRLFRGELDWVVMKALEKERDRRYETAGAFAADVERYLHNEAVLACPPSASYRFRKFARRKKTTLAMAACVLVALSGIAGSVGWAVRDKGAREDATERDRLAREKALDEAVARSLDETGPLIEEGKWPEALAIIERTEQLLAAAGRTRRPARQLDLRKDLTMAERLEGIYRGPKQQLKGKSVVQTEYGTDPTFGAQHDDFDEDDFDEEVFSGRRQDADFATAFREIGIDTESLSAAEAAAQIKGRTIRLALVKAFDDWTPLRRRARGEQDADWKKLVEIARQADPDDWRNRCRDAVLERDREALEELANSVPLRELPPATLYLLANALKEVGGLEKAMELLVRAQHEYPSDVWINDALAYFSSSACQPPRWDDALRFYTAALALRPGFAPFHRSVAGALKAKGAVAEALVEYTAAIELEPQKAAGWQARAAAYREFHDGERALADIAKAIELEPANVWHLQERARTYRELHQYEPAMTDLTKAIELEPTNAIVWNNRGTAYRDLRQYDKALADYSKAIELDSNLAMAWHNRAHALEAVGQPREALTDLSEAIVLEPKEARHWTCRGNVYGKLRQYDTALADNSKAIELEPNFAIAWNNRGNVYNELRRYDQALADFSKASELDAKYAAAWYNRGNAYTALQQHGQAVANYSKAIDLDPNLAVAWYNRGNAYRALRQYDTALADYSNAIALDPKDARFWSNQGDAYSALQQYDKAVADYSKAIELEPNLAVAWHNRGNACRELREYDEALADLNKAIELEPKDAMAWNNRGNAYNDLQQYDKALADYSKAIELDPKDATAWYNRGNAYHELRQYDQAIADYSKAIELDPKDAAAWHNRGNAYHVLRQYDKALADWCKSIELDPKDAAAWYSRGNAYRELRHYDEAVADYSRAIELDPKQAMAWNTRGAAYNELQQYDKAIADYSKVIELEPSNVEAHNNLAWLLATCPEAKFRDPARAVELAKKAVELAPEEGGYWNTLGVAHYRAGDWKAAVEALDKLGNLRQRGTAFDFYFLAMAYAQLGELDRARQWHQQALAWQEKNAQADPQPADELRRFRAEAEELLGKENK